eukprot:TRINITY_DN584_c0_g1_i22.p1 TRINITY_DN584_c0_g1~~TRINITY_DN584_c0_g1_i22.p1  ORF type:complete len:172 (-),score=16.10 TRINITY_DN584_c0_g1_i22:330-845(-)
MEEKKECGGHRKKVEKFDIKINYPSHVGDPKLDHMMWNFFNKLSLMNYTELSELPMFKKMKDIREEAFAEAQKMSYLQYGNYFAVNSLTFIVNYRTEVLLSLLLVRPNCGHDGLLSQTRQMGTPQIVIPRLKIEMSCTGRRGTIGGGTYRCRSWRTCLSTSTCYRTRGAVC